MFMSSLLFLVNAFSKTQEIKNLIITIIQKSTFVARLSLIDNTFSILKKTELFNELRYSTLLEMCDWFFCMNEVCYAKNHYL